MLETDDCQKHQVMDEEVHICLILMRTVRFENEKSTEEAVLLERMRK